MTNHNLEAGFCGKFEEHKPHLFGEHNEVSCGGISQAPHFHQTITVNGKCIECQKPYLDPFRTTVIVVGLRDLIKSLFLWRRCTVIVNACGDSYAHHGIATIDWLKIIEQSR